MKFTEDFIQTFECNLIEKLGLDDEKFLVTSVEQYMDTEILRVYISRIDGKGKTSSYDREFYQLWSENEFEVVEPPAIFNCNLTQVASYEPGYGLRMDKEYTDAK